MLHIRRVLGGRWLSDMEAGALPGALVAELAGALRDSWEIPCHLHGAGNQPRSDGIAPWGMVPSSGATRELPRDDSEMRNVGTSHALLPASLSNFTLLRL